MPRRPRRADDDGEQGGVARGGSLGRAGAQVAVVGDPAPGSTALDRYRLLERLGAGGFGVVWRARDELLGREVALKRVALADGDSERATREALAAARLAHPAIVALYEACAAPDAFYLISELVRGSTLAQLIAAGALDDARVLQIGLALTDALAHAHERGVIHRDVKPQNVLVPEDRHEDAPHRRGSPAVAKLTDFGGARVAGDDVLTRTGDVLGTLAYMAPEQCDGGEVGEAADLYSLALIIYEAFAGENPVRGPTQAATARRIGSVLPPLRSARRDLPAQLTRALDRALAPEPADRGVLEDLRAALAQAHEQVWRDDPARPRRSRQQRAAEPVTARERAGVVAPACAAAARAADPRAAAAARAAPGLPVAQDHRRAADLPIASEPPVHREAARREREAPVEYSPQARPFAPPRGLWLGLAVAVIAWQAWSGRPGVSLLLAAAVAPLAMLPPRPGERPSAALGAGPFALTGVLAPLLGAVGLASAFPALAGQATRWRARAVAGALGYWWLILSEPLLTRRLWLGPPSQLPPRAAWEGSITSCAAHVLAPLLSFGVLFGALMWAAGAVSLPWLVRGRRAALDVIAVTTWSAALAAAAPLVDRGFAPGVAHANPRGLVLGAVLGALAAVAARALRGPV
ncbi:MAG TPA: serine/threonine-protein kinase [Solirubrobacteraceae bacterium]|nr:serine/threonine-protein kinase [Solirubrobacteraceae bacterium]